MDWIKRFLKNLFGLRAEEGEPPSAQKAAPPIKAPLSKSESEWLFGESTPIIEPLLKGMATSRWGNRFRYEAQPEALRWSVWYTDTNSFVTEYWSATIDPHSAQLQLSCAPNRIIRTGITPSEVEKGLGRVARLGPANRNIPVENILDENI